MFVKQVLGSRGQFFSEIDRRSQFLGNSSLTRSITVLFKTLVLLQESMRTSTGMFIEEVKPTNLETSIQSPQEYPIELTQTHSTIKTCILIAQASYSSERVTAGTRRSQILVVLPRLFSEVLPLWECMNNERG